MTVTSLDGRVFEPPPVRPPWLRPLAIAVVIALHAGALFFISLTPRAPEQPGDVIVDIQPEAPPENPTPPADAPKPPEQSGPQPAEAPPPAPTEPPPPVPVAPPVAAQPLPPVEQPPPPVADQPPPPTPETPPPVTEPPPPPPVEQPPPPPERAAADTC